MLKQLTTRAASAVPLTPLTNSGLARWLRQAKAPARAWVKKTSFAAKAGETCHLPGNKPAVLLGLGDGSGGPWAWGGLPASLPKDTYRITPEPDAAMASDAALGWALGSYRFGRYKKMTPPRAMLVWPKNADRPYVEAAAEAVFLARDLINTPANDMGPPELAAAARDLAKRFGARCKVISGDDLLKQNYPMVHAVGRASSKPPCLIDITWGSPSAPKLTLVGKGVCFDSGGLDIKSASNKIGRAHV